MASIFTVGPDLTQFTVDVTNDVMTLKLDGVQVLGERGAAVADAAAATATTVAAAIPAAAPAGGVGAAAGGWDTAANRDAAIVTINDLRTYAIEQKADFNAIVADVADLRTELNLALARLRSHGLIA